MVASIVLPFRSAFPCLHGLGSSLADLPLRWVVSARQLRPRINEATALNQRLHQTQKRLRTSCRRVSKLPPARRER
jgi:uncharacterized protein involved in propanediol utilization